MVQTQWNIRRSTYDEVAIHEVYELYPSLISLKLHHGGFFTKYPGKVYYNGKINFIDLVDTGKLSFQDLRMVMAELGNKDDVSRYYHFKVPNFDLDFGLQPLANDEHTLNMFKHAPKCKIIEVYSEAGKELGHIQTSDATDVYHVKEMGEATDVYHVTGTNMAITNFDLFEDFDPFYEVSNKEMAIENRIEEDDDVAEDSDFEGGEGGIVGDVDVDMENFILNIDIDAEWIRKLNEITDRPNVDIDIEAMSLEELESASDDSDLESGSGGTHFYVGQVFGSKEAIKKRLDMHAVETRRDIQLVKNDLGRMRAVCKGILPEFRKNGLVTHSENKACCPWVLHISIGKHDKTWMVKTYVDTHKCLQSRKVKVCTTTWLSEQITDTIATNPDIPLKSLREGLEKRFMMKVSQDKTFRAKTMAIKKVRGDYAEQYTYLRDYICELQRINPETTVKLEVEREVNISSTTRQFKRIYICLGVLKKGFKAGLRNLLGLDGAFMKGPFPGQILTAVGIDPNNGIYPLAYAIVEAETTQSWSWFLEYLGDDLDLSVNSNFTFISDRQKGIIPAIAKLHPCADHRYCVRHIYENMKLTWKGKAYEEHIWKCAKACTVPLFDKAMEELKKLNVGAYEWLKRIPPQRYFDHSDVLLNNMCEVFNKQLVDARDKPIITALEYIRGYLMKRIASIQKLIDKEDGPLTPTTTMLDSIKEEAAEYVVIWNGGDEYQVSGPRRDQCVVDVNKKVCSCRYWELTGIPCKHAVATIWNISANGGDVALQEAWVHPVYWLDTWKTMYSFKVSPTHGRLMWPKFGCPSTLTPPKHHTQVGRPRKKRRKTAEELSQAVGKGSKLSRL
ncbi:hypothetical protein OSB04_016529 [Centaurea solstitialis]|uniref:SWIM-type domain-containing protein n=1 Tax=Centaurea solstitialis TaxID=347529 RepID=A0AA38WJT4_9ASTR|nr:hypothetical protein OSB04_016529 [Centaurea solstitialis]